MQPTSEKPFCLQDFEPFLMRMVEEEQEGAVIGGIAVSAWAEMLLLPEEKAKFDLPIYSKDLDLRGHKPVFSALTKEFQNDGAEIRGMAYATRKNAPHMGRVFAVSFIWRGQRTSLEVLERLPGLDRDIDTPPAGSTLATTQGFPLLDPCSLFICKLHAANTRPGEGAENDVKHLRLLNVIIPRFLLRLRESSDVPYTAREDAARLMKLIEDCQTRRHEFRVPLPDWDVDALVHELRQHLVWCGVQQG